MFLRQAGTIGAAEQEPQLRAPLTRAPGLNSERNDTEAVGDDAGHSQSIERLSPECPCDPERSHDNGDEREFANGKRDPVDRVVRLNAPDQLLVAPRLTAGAYVRSALPTSAARDTTASLGGALRASERLKLQQGDTTPHELNNPERPCACKKPINARQQTTRGKSQREARVSPLKRVRKHHESEHDHAKCGNPAHLRHLRAVGLEGLQEHKKRFVHSRRAPPHVISQGPAGDENGRPARRAIRAPKNSLNTQRPPAVALTSFNLPVLTS